MTHTLAIIGGGISGAFVAIHCLRRAQAPLRILWFDQENRFCKGLAYSTTDDAHLLNVRASNMSVFPDVPSHFADWLRACGYTYLGSDFVPRRIYGDYVSDTFRALREQNPLVEVTQIPEEVISMTRSAEGFSLTAQQSHHARRVVLAIGNFPPRHPRAQDEAFARSRYYFQDAFSTDVLSDEVLAKSHITILGAGLTMIDLVLALKQRQYTGRLSILSPHGYLPQAHVPPGPAAASYIDPQKHYDLLQLFALVKGELTAARREGRDPYAVIDALRPHVQRLWLGFSTADQERFLRHLRHKWGVARHRAPSTSLEVLSRAIAAGKLAVIKGRIYRIEVLEGQNFHLCYRDEKGEDAAFDTDVIINCTGPEPDITRLDSALVKQLMQSGLVESHPLAYGLKAMADGTLSEGLFTIGPPLKGVLWESTAVPEIRLQAAVLAGKLF